MLISTMLPFQKQHKPRPWVVACVAAVDQMSSIRSDSGLCKIPVRLLAAVRGTTALAKAAALQTLASARAPELGAVEAIGYDVHAAVGLAYVADAEDTDAAESQADQAD